ncbi:hypothetical protein BURK2_01042 [Burkholderiales bacterium]|nr:hypothetical protein BURK2_01042 [Burkholderiales bacterium]
MAFAKRPSIAFSGGATHAPALPLIPTIRRGVPHGAC